MVIGATIDYRDGFTGCMRALLLNGQLIDLRSYARRGLYGVSTDCVGRCDSSPCLNNGTCYERYDGYTCDCRWSAFKGPICADGSYLFSFFFYFDSFDFNFEQHTTFLEEIQMISFIYYSNQIVLSLKHGTFFFFLNRNRCQFAIEFIRQIWLFGQLAFNNFWKYSRWFHHNQSTWIFARFFIQHFRRIFDNNDFEFRSFTCYLRFWFWATRIDLSE